MDFLHALHILKDKCTGKSQCMRICPTQAIRVTDGKAILDPTLCVDCGECIVACPENAIRSTTDTLKDIEKFKYKVAVPSPTLFGQFHIDIMPGDITEGLLKLGFDAVDDMALGSELINFAIRDYLDEYRGPYPVISSSCPVVVRLIQVAYPDMVDQIVPIEPPREVSGREMKKRLSAELGLKPEEIGAIYITPCPAKMISIKQPAEHVKSYLDLAIGISEIYNPLLSAITKAKQESKGKDAEKQDRKHKHAYTNLSWILTGGQSLSLKPSRYITIAQINNMIRIFDDIEKGKIRGVEFLECYACMGGCIGGPLTVDDMFVSRSKIQKLLSSSDQDHPAISEAKRIYKKGDYMIRQKITPRSITGDKVDLAEQIRRMQIKEELSRLLPGINCGLCGAPSCKAFAQDVADARASTDDCVLLSSEKIIKIRKQYGIDDDEEEESSSNS
jgi:iron only hydrogenase large subunit-like protein